MESEASARIARELLQLIITDVVFTDVQIKPGQRLAYRAPRGYEMLQSSPVSAEDIRIFADFADRQWARKLEIGNGQFDTSLSIGDHSRLRCNFFRYGPDNNLAVTVRRLPFLIPDIDALGLPAQLKQFVEQRSKGLILVTGSTGTGKTTTQAAMLEYVNVRRAVHIITIEQPIEYVITSKRAIVTQRDVPTNVPNFAAGLEAAKRQRPDIIMIGESRDRDTVDTMLNAADSGHLVIGTMHSKSAEDTFNTLLAFYTGDEIPHKRNLIASVLICIDSQVLIPSRDGRKLVLGYELLVNNAAVSQVIRQGKFSQIENTITTSGTKDGSILLNEVLADKVRRREIRPEDALRESYKPEELQRQVAAYA
jgi:twitching motility protein PilT